MESCPPGSTEVADRGGLQPSTPHWFSHGSALLGGSSEGTGAGWWSAAGQVGGGKERDGKETAGQGQRGGRPGGRGAKQRGGLAPFPAPAPTATRRGTSAKAWSAWRPASRAAVGRFGLRAAWRPGKNSGWADALPAPAPMAASCGGFGLRAASRLEKPSRRR